MQYKMFSWNNGESNKLLAKALGPSCKHIKHKNSRYRYNPYQDVIINWGASELPARIPNRAHILNHPAAVRIVCDKLSFFRYLSNFEEVKDIIPAWSSTYNGARNMMTLPNGHTRKMVCRSITNGHGGKGMTIVDKPEDLPRVPLYTEYILKSDEFRIHIFRGKIIFMQRKARKLETPDDQVNWQIRSHDNGFIFQHKDIQVPEVCQRASLKVMELLPLDFGACDVIYNRRQKRAWVLEVNSAPGIEGTSIEKYKEAFNQYKEQLE